MRQVSLSSALSAPCVRYPLSVTFWLFTLHCELLESRNLILGISVLLKVYSLFLHRLHTLFFSGRRRLGLLCAFKIMNCIVPPARFFNSGSRRPFAVCRPRCDSPLPLSQRQLVVVTTSFSYHSSVSNSF